MSALRILLDPQGGEGNGSSSPSTDAAGTGKAPDLAAAFVNLAEKLGGQQAAGEKLYSENKGYRDRIKELEARVPPAGSAILSPDDARAWEAYRSIGTPDSVRKVIREHGELTTEMTGLRRNDELRTIADRVGAKFSVLQKVAGGSIFEIAKGKDAQTGKEVESVVVKDGPDSAAKPFDEAFADFLPALKPDANTAPSRPPGFGSRTPTHTTNHAPPPPSAPSKPTPSQRAEQAVRGAL